MERAKKKKRNLSTDTYRYVCTYVVPSCSELEYGKHNFVPCLMIDQVVEDYILPELSRRSGTSAVTYARYFVVLRTYPPLKPLQPFKLKFVGLPRCAQTLIKRSTV